MSNDQLNESKVRERFPALHQPQIFFDNAGGSQTLGTVIDSIKDYLSGNNAQLGGSYATSQRATASYQEAHRAGARFINAHSDEIVYGASTTQLLRNVSFALELEPGDEIVVSAIDHEANISPWVDLARRQRLGLRWWKPNDPVNPRLLLDDLSALLSPRTKLVACTHASNVLGCITDIKAIAAEAHAVGALVCVDGVAYAPHRPIDVQDLGVDFYVFSWYKVFGPHVAMLYASWRVQTRLRSLGHFFNPQATLEDKLGLAGASYELCQAVPRVVEYLTQREDMWPEIEAQERKLHTQLLDTLHQIPGVTVYGLCDEDRLPTISFTVRGQSSKALVEVIEADGHGYGLRWGSFYSQRLVRDVLGLGPEGVVRVSMVHYNTGRLDSPSRLVSSSHWCREGGRGPLRITQIPYVSNAVDIPSPEPITSVGLNSCEPGSTFTCTLVNPCAQWDRPRASLHFRTLLLYLTPGLVAYKQVCHTPTVDGFCTRIPDISIQTILFYLVMLMAAQFPHDSQPTL